MHLCYVLVSTFVCIDDDLHLESCEMSFYGGPVGGLGTCRSRGQVAGVKSRRLLTCSR